MDGKGREVRYAVLLGLPLPFVMAAFPFTALSTDEFDELSDRLFVALVSDWTEFGLLRRPYRYPLYPIRCI